VCEAGVVWYIALAFMAEGMVWSDTPYESESSMSPELKPLDDSMMTSSVYLAFRASRKQNLLHNSSNTYTTDIRFTTTHTTMSSTEYVKPTAVSFIASGKRKNEKK